MKKRFSITLITLLLLLTACTPGNIIKTVHPTPTPEPSPSDTIPTLPSALPPAEETLQQTPSGTYTPVMPDTDILNNAPLQVLAAYHEILITAVDEYGYGDGSGGVIYVNFVDLDNDGTPEMIYIYSDGTVDWRVESRIYGYVGNPILHASYELFPTHTNEIRKATGHSGLSYLTSSHEEGFDGYKEYYTIVNGVWALALRLSWSEKDDTAEGMDIDENDPDSGMDASDNYYINGNLVDWESYNNAPETELGIINEHILWNWWGYMGEDYPYKNDNDWCIDVAEYWETVPVALAALESLLNAS